jgi:large subunit ribosomal protein L9
MKLILLKEVPGLGVSGDTVEVKDGYGRNYLLPQGLAFKATKGAERQVADLRRARAARQLATKAGAEAAAAHLATLTITLTAKAGQGGRLFGSVTSADVVAAVSAAGGPALERRTIEIADAIKTVGSHEVSVRLHPEVTQKVTLEVVAG